MNTVPMSPTISTAWGIASGKNLQRILFHFGSLIHHTITPPHHATLVPLHRTLLFLPPIPSPRICSPLLLAGSNQLVQDGHVGDFARGPAAAAMQLVFGTRH